MAALNICREAADVFDVMKNGDMCPNERTILADVLAQLNLNENDWVEDGINLQDEPMCKWKYITCTGEKIQMIRINSASLSGTISPSIGRLTYLEVLNLLDHQIGGEIP